MEQYCFPREQMSFIESMRVPFAVYQYISKRVIPIALSEGFRGLFGYESLEEAYDNMTHNIYRDVHPDDAARIGNSAFRFATEGGDYDVIFRVKPRGASEYTVIHAIGEHIYTENGTRLAQIWYTDEGTYKEDIEGTELAQAMSKVLREESILKDSHYDYLTGLPGMTYFFELAEIARNTYIEEGKEPVLMFMDLSGMKYFNSKNSFAEGDNLLRAFAAVLTETFNSEGCCRIGADHFAAFTTEDQFEEKIKVFFRKCQEMNGGNSLPVHVGVYPNRMGLVPISTACDRAKLACDAIKNTYSSCYNYYSQEFRDSEEQRQYIMANIDRAISEHWITVYYQPIIRAVSGKVCDEEALARWIDPERGFLSPADFIPYLEDARVIYKLDLYVLEQVLKKIKFQKDSGLFIVPQSINLSRSDFDVCDIVEEVRRRVDEAGVSRDMIAVEITESTIGSEFEFMKEQVRRFRELGFPVWMDDFGNGYSSLDVLQSIRFDLLKFDMSFMKRLDEGEQGKILLTELMRMSNAIGMDTVCEGVETKEQMKFLYEIGCSKVQGYYFEKPIPLEKILEKYRAGIQIGCENPDESEYFETIGRLNMFDLSVIASGEENLHNAYSTIPIGIIEVKGEYTRFVRSNQSYRDFIKHFFGFDLNFEGTGFARYDATFMVNIVKTCCEQGVVSFYDEQMPDGAVVHSFARRVGINPVTGSIAVAIAVLSITSPGEGTTYAGIARALAADYYNIYYVDLDTESFIEYTSPVGGEEIAIERHGEGFFDAVRRDAMTRIYEEDRESFLAGFSKEKILKELDSQGVYTAIYRLVDSGVPMYANMKITRMQGTNKIILGISIIDSQMKQQEEEKKLRQEKVTLGRIAALAPNYLVLYTVNPETGHYTQYNPSNEFKNFGLAGQGDDFFKDVVADAPKAIDPDDIERHLRTLTKENVMNTIRENGFFLHNYRLKIEGKSVPVSLRATLSQSENGEEIIIGVIKDEEAYRRYLEEAYKKASSTAVIYTHIAHALARGYTDLYYVNMDTDELIEFHTDDEHGVLSEVRRSSDFFEGCKRDAEFYIHEADREKFVNAMNKKNLEDALKDNSVFEMTYRRIKDGRSFYVLMRVSKIEDDERLIVIAVQDIDDQIKKKENDCSHNGQILLL